jgi:two-component system chemotaxis sensor kinase CheA
LEFKIFDTLLEPVFIINNQCKVIYCNEPAVQISGLTMRKLLKLNSFEEAFKFNPEINVFKNIEEITDPTPYKELYFETQEGQKGKVQITCQAMSSGNESSWLIYFRDVTLEETLQKKYQQELEKKESVIKDLETAQVKLQDYSKNLEVMVSERTAELSKAHQHKSAMLNSLSQGFFVFGEDGVCLNIYSKACETILEVNPSGELIWDVLRVLPEKVSGFKKWMLTVFDEMLPFDDLAPLGPDKLNINNSKFIQFEYYPMRGENDKIEAVVVVATDITSLVEARIQAENDRIYAKMIISLINNKKEFGSFLRDSKNVFTELKLELDKKELDLNLIFRSFHTLKGGAASFAMQLMSRACHDAEGVVSQISSGKNLPPDKLEQLKHHTNLIEKLFYQFLEENKKILGTNIIDGKRVIEVDAEKMRKFSQEVNKMSPQLSKKLMTQFMMEPVGSYFQYTNEMIQKMAQELGKSIDPVVMTGADTPILSERYSQLFGTLVHAFRNQVDHGIETQEERMDKGKPLSGKIEIDFLKFQKQDQDFLLIKIQDDGAGISPDKIRKKLIEKNISSLGKTDQEVIQSVFLSHFSTKSEVSMTSGRGVGMDAILVAAQSLGGTAWVESNVDKGTKLFIEVPYFSDFEKNDQSLAS